MKYFCKMVWMLIPLTSHALPSHFVYLHSTAPHILQDIRYASDKNFIGAKIPGYQAQKCILTRETANALLEAANHLQSYNLGLKVYDCYRPERAVAAFIAWSKDPHNQINKQTYYPRIDKKDLFKENYLATKSAHSRGSTVDVTLVDCNGKELAMGTHFDYLDSTSNAFDTHITDVAKMNRQLLRSVMVDAGFKPLPTEWWHFTLSNEPYPQTYFDFVVR